MSRGKKGPGMDDTAISLHHCICGMSVDLHGCPEFRQGSARLRVEWTFTLDNYRKILEPVYLNTFVQSMKLAFTSTVLIALIGYPFGYFMAKMPDSKKHRRRFS